MDPDLVRQQEEAEREAMGLAPKSASVASLAAQQRNVTGISNIASAYSGAYEAQSSSSASVGAQHAPDVSFVGALGRFFSYGLAGAMFGSGVGIAAKNLMDLSAHNAQMAFIGAASCFALLGAIFSQTQSQ